MTMLQRMVPWTVLVLSVCYVLMAARPKKESGPFDFQLLGAVPVSADGRTKPFDTMARNGMMIISDRQYFPARRQSPICDEMVG